MDWNYAPERTAAAQNENRLHAPSGKICVWSEGRGELSSDTSNDNEIRTTQNPQQALLHPWIRVHHRFHRHLVSHWRTARRDSGARGEIWNLRRTVGSDFLHSLESLRPLRGEGGLMFCRASRRFLWAIP